MPVSCALPLSQTLSIQDLLQNNEVICTGCCSRALHRQGLRDCTVESSWHPIKPGFTWRMNAFASPPYLVPLVGSMYTLGEQLVPSRTVPVHQTAWLQLLAENCVQGVPVPALPAEV